MAKLTKEELISKIKDSEIDNEIKISLLEDVADSFEDNTSEWEAKYKDLEEKYIARFTEKTEDKSEETETEEPKEDESEEMEEKEVIDIQEI